MIGVIPVTLTDVRRPVAQPLSDPWTTTDFHHWLDASRPYSLVHYWQTASWGTFDVRYRLADPVAMKDPRPNLPDGSQNDVIRPHLLKEVIATAHRKVGFVGDGLSGIILMFMTPCDQFGGSMAPVPLSSGSTVQLPTCVNEIYNAFDLHAHEVGHMFGLNHSMDASTQTDYGSPYDIMSAGVYGGRWAMHIRPGSEGLPDGLRHPEGTDPRDTHVPPQRVVGPLLSGAQVTRLPSFARFGVGSGVAGVVVDIGDKPQREKVTIRLHALDHSRAAYPEQRLPAVVRTTGIDGITYLVELRRGGARALYDQGIGERAPWSPPEAVVIHHFDSRLDRMMYDGAATMAPSSSETPGKFESESGGISIQVATAAGDATWADVAIERHIPGLLRRAGKGTIPLERETPTILGRFKPGAEPLERLGPLDQRVSGAARVAEETCDLASMKAAGLRATTP